MFMALVTDQQMVRMSHEELFGEQQQMFRVFFSQHTLTLKSQVPVCHFYKSIVKRIKRRDHVARNYSPKIQIKMSFTVVIFSI